MHGAISQKVVTFNLGSGGGEDIDVDCNAVWTRRQITTFSTNILPSSSGLQACAGERMLMVV
jgi:hypothetical protein